MFGIPVHNLTQRECVSNILERARLGTPAQVVTANLDFALQAWRDPEMHRILFDADLVVADGTPLVWFSRLFGSNLKERVAGSDLVAPIARQASLHSLSLYALGAAPGVADRAMAKLQQSNPGLLVAGTDSPPCAPLARMNHQDILKKIEDARPDILLVAYGAPKQDKWIRMHIGGWNVPVAIGVGATLDFIAGEHQRAPRWFQAMGMEWFWRMAREPRRLAHRYLADFVFLGKMLAKLAILRVKPSEAAPSWGPNPARVSDLGATLAPFRPLRNAERARAFLHDVGPQALDRPLVLDLSGIRWLNSMELGALTHLARVSRRRGHRLVLCSVSPRIRELLREFRLDHYMETPRSNAELESTLENLKQPAENGRAYVRMSENRMHVLLPAEFGRDQASAVRVEVLRRWKSSRLQGIVIDGSRTAYVDGPAAQWISEVGRLVVNANATMWLRGFRVPILKFIRQEGLGRIGKSAPSPGWKSRRSVRHGATSTTA